MSWLKSLKKIFTGEASPSTEPLDEDTVFFAGPDTSGAALKKGDYWFWIENPVNGNATIDLPAVTSDKAVIEQLMKMKIGDAFRITAESAEGGLGTRVHAIETHDRVQPNTLPRCKI